MFQMPTMQTAMVSTLLPISLQSGTPRELCSSEFLEALILRIKGKYFINNFTKGRPQKEKNRIFHDIEQNLFDTYPPYQIMTNYIMTF